MRKLWSLVRGCDHINKREGPLASGFEGGSYLSLDFRDKLLPDKQYVLDWWQHYPGFLKSCMCADMLIVRV